MTTEFLADGEEDLRGGLRHLILRLNRPQLCLVNGWIQRELDRAQRSPGHRMVRVPDLDDSAGFSGDIVELLGQVRRQINTLPRGSLVVLNHWVVTQIEEHLAED